MRKGRKMQKQRNREEEKNKNKRKNERKARKKVETSKTHTKQHKITTENVIDLMLMHEQSGHVSKEKEKKISFQS